MSLSRLQLKLFVADPRATDLSAGVGIFQRWIRDGVLPELMIDVADYSHVHHGPGVLLIGHTSDYGLDMGEGRPGLLYARKRDFVGELAEQLREAFGRLWRAAALLESEPSLQPAWRFRNDEILLRVPDRLHFSNTPAAFATLAPPLRDFLTELYGEPERQPQFDLQQEGSERDPLTVRIRVATAVDAVTLRQRLGI